MKNSLNPYQLDNRFWQIQKLQFQQQKLAVLILINWTIGSGHQQG